MTAATIVYPLTPAARVRWIVTEAGEAALALVEVKQTTTVR